MAPPPLPGAHWQPEQGHFHLFTQPLPASVLQPTATATPCRAATPPATTKRRAGTTRTICRRRLAQSPAQPATASRQPRRRDTRAELPFRSDSPELQPSAPPAVAT